MKLRHICEVCGRDEVLDPEEAYQEGWDYPPRMGFFGVVSPRTCPNCPIDKTVWWAITIEKQTELSPEQMAVVERILGEPASIEVRDGPPPYAPFVPADPKTCTCVNPFSVCPTHG